MGTVYQILFCYSMGIGECWAFYYIERPNLNIETSTKCSLFKVDKNMIHHTIDTVTNSCSFIQVIKAVTTYSTAVAILNFTSL